jgi:SAM-dependent methyltransferase
VPRGSVLSTLEPSGANADQIRYWNEQAGPRWVAHQALLDAQLAGLGARAIERAAVAAGDAVLDVGCGCGATSLELARRTGDTGSVLGVDISAPMLALARQRAAEAGARKLRFALADAQTHQFACESIDVVFSRFGVMFFTDPVAAFANLRRALKPGGRLAFVCWQALPLNPWMALPLGVIAQHLTLPPPPAPDAPGPFSFASRERVERILDEAGFAEVVVEPVAEQISVGGAIDLDRATEFVLTLGPAGVLLRDAPADVRTRVASAVRAALAPSHGPDGVRMDSAAWIVRARSST